MLDREKRHQYLSEAFHGLAQPITALHCGLEVALAKPRTASDYEKRIGDALEITGVFRELTSALRELVDADDAGRDSEEIDLADLFVAIRAAVSDIADLHAVAVEFEPAAKAKIRAHRERLVRAVVLLAEQVLVPAGRVHFGNRKLKEGVEITIRGQRQTEIEMQRVHAVTQIRLSAADTYIHALAGRLTILEEGYRIELPIAEAPRD